MESIKGFKYIAEHQLEIFAGVIILFTIVAVITVVIKLIFRKKKQ